MENILPLMNYVRNTPKLRKMPILNTASSELSAICYNSAGSSFR